MEPAKKKIKRTPRRPLTVGLQPGRPTLIPITDEKAYLEHKSELEWDEGYWDTIQSSMFKLTAANKQAQRLYADYNDWTPDQKNEYYEMMGVPPRQDNGQEVPLSDRETSEMNARFRHQNPTRKKRLYMERRHAATLASPEYAAYHNDALHESLNSHLLPSGDLSNLVEKYLTTPPNRYGDPRVPLEIEPHYTIPAYSPGPAPSNQQGRGRPRSTKSKISTQTKRPTTKRKIAGSTRTKAKTTSTKKLSTKEKKVLKDMR